MGAMGLMGLMGLIGKLNTLKRPVKHVSLPRETCFAEAKNEEMKKYYERVEPYFKFMARSVGKYVDISPYIESLSILTN